jgi:hypothetical protein
MSIQTNRLIDSVETNIWYLNGVIHREDGPAFILGNGSKIWYLNGVIHRIDGPAVEYIDGGKLWYLNGLMYSEEKYNKIIKLVRKIVREIKTKVRNKYISYLKETNICDEKYLYNIIAEYMI